MFLLFSESYQIQPYSLIAKSGSVSPSLGSLTIQIPISRSGSVSHITIVLEQQQMEIAKRKEQLWMEKNQRKEIAQKVEHLPIESTQRMEQLQMESNQRIKLLHAQT